MKKTKIILSAALLLAATGAQSMADQFKNGVLHFDYKAEELAPAEAAARGKLINLRLWNLDGPDTEGKRERNPEIADGAVMLP